jgi:MFS family permease
MSDSSIDPIVSEDTPSAVTTESTSSPPWEENISDSSNTSDDTVIISTNTALDGYRLKNFYMTNAFQWFVWMVFHFSVVFFFTFQLKSVALVWIFLWIANFIAFLLDIPVGILQKHYSTKKLFIIAAISQLVAVAIFFNFIYWVFSVAGDVGKMIVPDGFSGIISWFFSSALNWVLIVIASVCYGLTKEINDISTFGYILSHAHPSEYGKILARNNITYWLWSLVWLVISGFVLTTNPTIAILFLGIAISLFLAFTIRFFDNSSESLTLSDVTSFTVWVRKMNTENVKEYLTEKISAVDLEKVIATAKYVFLKPKQKQENKINWKEFGGETIKTAKIIWKIMSHVPIYIIIYWTMTLVLIFWFWDTFASTFLVSFLDNIKPGWSYILLACIAIPALWLQELAGKLADKIGIKTVAFIGLGLSGASLIGMGIMAFIADGSFTGTTTIIFLVLALFNSLWYACGMSLGQNQFLDTYNTIYAKTLDLKEIDSNASAGPMKILQNAANVIWLVFWWLMLEVLWYGGFFILFGIVIVWALIWSISKSDEITL